MRKTFGSRSISSVMAWFRASRKEITGMIRSLLGDIWGHRDVFVEGVARGRLALLGERDALLDLLLDRLLHAVDRLLVDAAALVEDILVADDGVIPDRRVDLVLEAILARVADRVPLVAVSLGLDEGGAFAGARPMDRLAGRPGHELDVVAVDGDAGD